MQLASRTREKRFPLILTCTKDSLYCESQHRGPTQPTAPSARPTGRSKPRLQLPGRNIEAGDWVLIKTPNGQVRARARFDKSLDPLVVCGQHGWWQACPEIGAPGYDAFGPESANFNLVIGHDAIDPISGSVPLRAYVCEVTRLD